MHGAEAFSEVLQEYVRALEFGINYETFEKRVIITIGYNLTEESIDY